MVVNGVTHIELPGRFCDSLQEPEVALPCFVAGPENRLTVAAFQRLMDPDPLDSSLAFFNPFVLVGPTGSGKSHLARGICRKYHLLFGDEGVAYFTAIDFARQLQTAREEAGLEVFRDRLSNVSLLIVEDLQKLPEREFVQRELRDLIELLVSAERIVLITSQQSPSTMLQQEVGLCDRLASGLTIQLRPPGFPARQEILQMAAGSYAVSLNSQQLESIAKSVDGPAPQLLRALAKVKLDCCHDLDASQLGEPIRLKQIIAVVARYFSITHAALCSPNRRKSLVHARAVVVHLARKLTDLSYTQIGQGLGRRDHTTIMQAHRNIRQLLADDPAIQQSLDQLQRILTAP